MNQRTGGIYPFPNKSTCNIITKVKNIEIKTVTLIVLEGEYRIGDSMYSPLIVDRTDPKWFLLDQVFSLLSSRRSRQELAKQGITPVPLAATAIRILLVSLFFSVDTAYVVRELNTRKKLRRFTGIPEVPTFDALYRFLSRFDEQQFLALVIALLNTCCARRKRRGPATILIDSTAITLDLNWFRRTFSREHLENREYRWGYSPTHGHYIGYKLTMAIEYPTLRAVGILLHPGSPHDAPLFEEIMDELKRRRGIRILDRVVFDKGYYSCRNYVQGIFRFSVVPLIFAKKNFSAKKLLGKLIYPLNIFGRSDTRELIQRYRTLATRLLRHLQEQSQFQEIRSRIEDVFKAAKNAFSLKRIHRYTTRSVTKAVCLNVLLTGLVISLGFQSKVQLQQLAEW
ncbi:MAG: transposase [Methanomicrobiales archaeon]|nr:transposase [Methanomicrobiales archaeon]